MRKEKKRRKFRREYRYFSESFRKARVREYEEGTASVIEISRTYQVSGSSVYKWIRKYSPHYQKGIVKVVELKSETKKRQALEKEVRELEQMIGQQQVRIQYYEQLVLMLSERYELDVEKNSEWKSLPGFSQIDPNTD